MGTLLNFKRLPSDPKRIGFLGFDGIRSLDLSGPLEAFANARINTRQDGPRTCYEPVIISLWNKTFESGSGAVFKAQHTVQTAPALDTIIIPGGIGLRDSELSSAIAAWLRTRAGETRRIAAVSGGIYPLARAGLLDGRTATTHWRLMNDVARLFPEVKINDAASFVQDEKFYTCGGGNAAIEMSLAMMEADFGSDCALAVARELVMNLRPPNGDERRLDLSHYQPGTEERLAELPAWITSRLEQDLSVETLAQRACLCPRHFARLFKRTFQTTPADFVEQLRISEAERRLTSQRLSIENVAASVGFRSAAVFRRAFERRIGMSPSSFKKRIRRTLETQRTGMTLRAA